jgi:hypothetical protein
LIFFGRITYSLINLRKQPIICLLVCLLLFFVPSLCNAQFDITYSTPYAIPDNDSQIQIVYTNGNSPFNGASFNNNIWFFSSENTGVSISAKNCNITITHCSPFTYANEINGTALAGYFRYTVEGVGEQTFKIHHNWDIPILWHVYIDNIEKLQGDGWDYSNGWITVKNAQTKVVVIAELFPLKIEAQFDRNGTYFISSDMNSTVYFTPKFMVGKRWVFNGTNTPAPAVGKPYAYYWKTVDNDATLSHSSWWNFDNIQSKDTVNGIWVKARNCKITINALSQNSSAMSQEETNHMYRSDYWLNYLVEGTGQQSFSVNLPSNSTDSVNFLGYYSVSIDGVVREKGDGWNYSENISGQHWLTVINAKSNVNIHTWSISSYNGRPNDYTPTVLGWAILACILIILILVSSALVTLHKNTPITQKNLPW